MTDRKLARRTLPGSGERHRPVVASARERAVAALAPESVTAGWDAGTDRVSGHAERKVLGRPGVILFTPEDRAARAVPAELRRARTDGRAENERRRLREDGDRSWRSGHAAPLAGDDGPGFRVHAPRPLLRRKPKPS